MKNYEETKLLVRSLIKGSRKWIDEPNYLHSFRVFDLLVQSWFDFPILLHAALLHDVIEDSDMTLDKLIELGYDEETVKIVDYCSHNKDIKDTTDRRKAMMARIIIHKEAASFLIKLADFTDNLATAHLLAPDKFDRFMTVKTPFFEKYGDMLFGDTPLFKKFQVLAEKQMVRLYMNKAT